jgi:hypothetical protein
VLKGTSKIKPKIMLVLFPKCFIPPLTSLYRCRLYIIMIEEQKIKPAAEKIINCRFLLNYLIVL